MCPAATLIKHFVYVDRTSDGVPFYVGKGNARRVHLLQRNKKHTAIANKYGQIRTIEFETDSLDIVNFEEVRLIASYETFIGDYPDNAFACNFTRGGEGQPGYKWTDDQRLALQQTWTDDKKKFSVQFNQTFKMILLLKHI